MSHYSLYLRTGMNEGCIPSTFPGVLTNEADLRLDHATEILQQSRAPVFTVGSVLSTADF